METIDSESANLETAPDGWVDMGVGNCRLYRLPKVQNPKGNLAIVEFEKFLPLPVKRSFWVFNVPAKEIRGVHAHKACHLFLTCLVGQVTVLLDDGANRINVKLDNPFCGLHLQPGVWGSQLDFSKDAMLLVFASHLYDASDFILNYDEYLKHSKKP